MNADASVAWFGICLLPFVLMMVVGVVVAVVLFTMRLAGGRRDLFEVSRPLRQFLSFAVPLGIVVVGLCGTVTLAEHDAAPLLVIAPLGVSGVLAVVAMIRLIRWSTAEVARRVPNPLIAPRATSGQPTPQWRKGVLIALAVILCNVGVVVVLAIARDGAPRGEKFLFGLAPLAVGGSLLWLAVSKLGPGWREKLTARLRSGVGPRVGLLQAVFSKMGVAIIVGGAVLTALFWVLTESGLLAVVFGGLFVFLVMNLHLSQLRAVSRLTTAQAAPAVAPLLLTPDPTAVRGDCPTCHTPIPADSPHGLCPRCLVRGAMPSPTSTRLRGVGPIDPPTAAEVNEFFPHLEVLELIGAGGMGAVYKARQPTLDRIVALKIVQSPRGDEDPVFAERFAREARAMAKLDHPSIVTIHESGEAGGLPYLLMEYVDGVTLREAMANRLLTAPEALAVIPQVCDALDFAHRAGVVHRDIKPENILLDQTGRVKIADFGLAKLADPKNVTLTRTQQAMGTPHYMAPEQWERPNEVDHRADIYALGVVLYELLTGELPLGRFALPSEKGRGDARLDQVVVKALAKDVGERFQTAGLMKAALSGVKLAAFPPAVAPRRKGFEFRSKTRLLGLPLVHVVAGKDPVTGKRRVAKGWVAVGDVMAVGGIAIGGVMGVGVVGVGGVLGAGLLALGGAIGLGFIGIGGNAAGVLFALGGNGVSFGLSIGGLAAGKFAIGGVAGGEYVLSDSGETPGFGEALWAWVRSLLPK